MIFEEEIHILVSDVHSFIMDFITIGKLSLLGWIVVLSLLEKTVVCDEKIRFELIHATNVTESKFHDV